MGISLYLLIGGIVMFVYYLLTDYEIHITCRERLGIPNREEWRIRLEKKPK